MDLQLRQRIKAWFHNHKRPSVSGGQLKGPKERSTSILNLRKRRMLQPCQAYHVLTYESKWKVEINHKWEAFNVAWAKDHPGEPIKKTRFEFMNNFIREKYQAETPEMKQRVEDFRSKTSEKSINKGFQESVFVLFRRWFGLPGQQHD